MPVEDKTLVYGLPKPHPTNRASEDVLRLRAALDQVDAQLDKEARKQAIKAPSVGADLLRNFQYSGFSDRADGGGTVRAWDPSGALLISNAIGGHMLASKRSITLSPGVYSVSMSGVFLADVHAWTGTPVEKKVLPIFAQSFVYSLNPDGTDKAKLGVVAFTPTDYLDADGASKTSPGFVVTEPTKVRPMLFTNGWEGARQIVITSILLGCTLS